MHENWSVGFVLTMSAHDIRATNQSNKMSVVIYLFAFSCLFQVQAVIENEKNQNGTLNTHAISTINRSNILLMMKELQMNGSYPISVPILRQNIGRQNSNSTSSSSENRRCVCQLGVCKCCTGLIMDLLNQKACMRVTYHPGDFAFDVAMSWNNRILYENSLSGKNPRPICISPPRLNNLKVCAKFYNVFFPGRNFHFCLAMSGQWGSLELFSFAFDCLRMGANGIAMVKPYEDGGLPVPNPHGGVDAVIDAGEDDIEDYDENVVKSLLGDLFDR